MNSQRARIFQKRLLFLKEGAVAIVSTIVKHSDMAIRSSENCSADGSRHAVNASPDTIPTRESLLSRIKVLEDHESWRKFFDTYWRLIYNLARKSGLNDAEAQDVVQDTVLSVARKIDGFRYDPATCTFKSWMLQITRWRISNQLKKGEREGKRFKVTSNSAAETGTVERIADPRSLPSEGAWDEEWEKNLLAAALERVRCRIDPEQFQIFDLYCLQEWPAAKVAATLGISAARVYLVKHRTASLLKKELARLKKEQA